MRITLFLISILLFSCGENPRDVKDGFMYVKDSNTGLCYSISKIGFNDFGMNTSTHFDSRTMTCVPCDSLKKVDVISIGK